MDVSLPLGRPGSYCVLPRRPFLREPGCTRTWRAQAPFPRASENLVDPPRGLLPRSMSPDIPDSGSWHRDIATLEADGPNRPIFDTDLDHDSSENFTSIAFHRECYYRNANASICCLHAQRNVPIHSRSNISRHLPYLSNHMDYEFSSRFNYLGRYLTLSDISSYLPTIVVTSII